jgi:Na+-transporting NADH:ubiquinone oxidoreductase subunit NqrD
VGVGIVVAGAAAVLGVAGTAAAATTAAATAAAAGTGVSWLTWVTSFIQKFVAKIIANPLEWLVQQLVKRKLIKFFKLEHILTPGGLWRTIKTRWQHWRERRG